MIRIFGKPIRCTDHPGPLEGVVDRGHLQSEHAGQQQVVATSDTTLEKTGVNACRSAPSAL